MTLKRILLALVVGFLASALPAQTPVILKLHAVAGTTPLALNQNFTQYNGETAVFTRLQYYLSRFYIIHDGGQSTPLPNVFLLVNPSRTDYALDSANVVNIEKIRFSVGVDATVNHDDPNSWPAQHPLAPQNPSMHWGWQAGYVFAALDGLGDSNNDSNPDTVFQIHPIGDQLLRDVEIPVTAVLGGNGLEISLDYDMQAWMRNIDLGQTGMAHGTLGAPTVAMDNTNMFQVFRAAGTVGTDEPQPMTHTLYFNQVEADRPIVFYTARDAREGSVALEVTGMDGRVHARLEGLPASGKQRVEQRLVQGVYFCTLRVEGNAVLTKKFIVWR